MNESTATENKKSAAVKKSRKTLMLSQQSVQGNEQSLVINEANRKPFFADADENSLLTITENKILKLNNIDPGVVDFYCRGINESKINLDDLIAKEKFLRRLNSQEFYQYPREMLTEIRLFIENWEKIKKQRTHDRIIEDPSKSRIIRPVDTHQFTTIHFFTRNQVFQIIGKQDRAKKTRIDDYGKVIDVSGDRTFLGWESDIHFTISGPVLCSYDQEVFDACIKIWHEKYTSVGITLITNLSEIWRTIGNSSKINGRNAESIKRSLDRLVKCTISAKSLAEKKNFWSGGIVDDVLYKEGTRNKDHQIIITFNKYMVRHYLDGAYAILSHPVYRDLSPYAKKMYLFLRSHRDKIRKMYIDKWREPLGISRDVPNKELKRNINIAIKELISFNVLDITSSINSCSEVCTLVCDAAWKAETVFIQNDMQALSQEKLSA